MSTVIDPLQVTQLRQRVAVLARLVEVSVTLNSTQELNGLLQSIITTGAELLDCEAASLMLYDDKKGQLLFTAATGSDPAQLSRIPVPLDGSLAGTIFCENRPLVINDVDQDPRHYRQVGDKVGLQIRSLLGVPMRVRDKVTGVLEAINKHDGMFTEQDMHVLSILGSQAAVAIYNAQMMNALQRAYDELSALDKMKSSFLAIASHELRTPLGIILGYATFLKEEAQGEVSEHAARVLNSAIHLRTLVEAMTNMNMLQMGLAELTLTPVALQQVVHSAVDEIAETARARGQQVLIDLPRQDIIVQADAEKLELVFINLLNNAIRFTPPKGKITIGLTSRPGEYVVAVQDTGIGIPPGELDNIFREFYQIEDHMTRHCGGMGLGLAIARELVALHKGRIWAESDGPSKGSVFKVALPKKTA